MKGKYLTNSYKFYKETLHENFFRPEEEEVEEEAANAVAVEVADESGEAGNADELSEEDIESIEKLPAQNDGAEEVVPVGDVPMGTPVTTHEVSIEFSMGGNDPNNPLGQTSFERPEWVVVRMMTDKGERVGMDKQGETDCEVLASNLSYADAERVSTEMAQKLELPEFNRTTDLYIGKISDKVVRRDKKDLNTSYKY